MILFLKEWNRRGSSTKRATCIVVSWATFNPYLKLSFSRNWKKTCGVNEQMKNRRSRNKKVLTLEIKLLMASKNEQITTGYIVNVCMYVCVYDLIYRTNCRKRCVRWWQRWMIQAKEYDGTVNENTADCRDVGKFVARKFYSPVKDDS